MDSLAPHASTSSLVLPTPSSASPSPAPPSSSRLEEYLLLLLSDSNLPTGGFVASSGLESFDQHGYISSLSKETGLVEFVKKSLDNYSKVNGEIVKRSWGLLEEYKMNSRGGKRKGKEVMMEEEDRVMEELLEVDRLCTSMILNQISSRASIAQGNALLSLYSRALAPSSPGYEDQGVVEVVERIRRDVRGAKGGWRGNQSTAFGIVMSATGLSLDRTLHLFLFLHARSILSSAVRLNLIGPYLAHRLLLWEIRSLVDEATESLVQSCSRTKEEEAGEEDWWENDREWQFVREKGGAREPVTTWPLGEIVASRHDQLFTKVFNS